MLCETVGRVVGMYVCVCECVCVKYSIIAFRSEAAKSTSRGLDLARSPEK